MSYLIFINSLSTQHKDLLNKHFYGGLKSSYKTYKNITEIFISPSTFAQYYLIFHTPFQSFEKRHNERLNTIENLAIKYTNVLNKEKTLEGLQLKITKLIEEKFFIILTELEFYVIGQIIAEKYKGE